VCGKVSLEALRIQCTTALPQDRPKLAQKIIHLLPEKLRKAQSLFDKTGGLHAAGLFDAAGRLVSLHEDVGRHNAVDKVVGEQFLARKLPLHEYVLLVSGRASFEIMQKALMAGLPFVAAVSAPSSLAVDVAARFGMTLLGFVRDQSFNLYTGGQRLQPNGRSVRQTVKT
jgi:FdhD protein